ncbi:MULTISPECIES: RsbT co-antagonist protein RsbRA [Alteribacter]|uniref:STAS domain-containing protein n=1 Tax=Alteribacter keqinensis TaxID=2483800 RepID=A0A3M7TLS8_9BACI|nr:MULTISPECIES: RsbT co-antagonist protein RsbRA [Alteribacter]MBM7096815.1 RsbT co-antagonist protein RsbRA [Alteribacter salitolerans]RNA66348.1 STAS domain-containing protein [Alteribacter keqinensis]
MNHKIRALIHEYKSTITDEWMEEVEKFREDDYLQNISDTVYRNTNREFVDMLFQTMDRDKEQVKESISEYTDRLIQLGWPLNYITRGLQEFRKAAIETLNQKEEHRYRDVYDEIEDWTDEIVNIVVSHYSGTWENTVFLQRMALKELSAPLIPVFNNISVMPLIGTIDTERAKQIMENLLTGVIEHRSQVVLIDITGVPVVDTMVAHHIIQASEAVRLVGAKCILVGIRPEIAQTIVNLGIDLGKFPTKSSLKKGIEAALEMTSRQIIEINE